MDAQEQARLKDLFNQSCCAAARYPCNLVFPGAYQHQLEEYLVLLNQLGPKIFCSDSKTAIDFLEVDDENAGKRILKLACPSTQDAYRDQVLTPTVYIRTASLTTSCDCSERLAIHYVATCKSIEMYMHRDIDLALASSLRRTHVQS